MATNKAAAAPTTTDLLDDILKSPTGIVQRDINQAQPSSGQVLNVQLPVSPIKNIQQQQPPLIQQQQPSVGFILPQYMPPPPPIQMLTKQQPIAAAPVPNLYYGNAASIPIIARAPMSIETLADDISEASKLSKAEQQCVRGGSISTWIILALLLLGVSISFYNVWTAWNLYETFATSQKEEEQESIGNINSTEIEKKQKTCSYALKFSSTLLCIIMVSLTILFCYTNVSVSIL